MDYETSNPPAPASPQQQNKKRSSKAITTAKPQASTTAPIFLRKTYTMIDTCDRSIAAWSDNGLTFVVKDTEKFSQEVIPEFFKHNNFSSFVRQLNFYGFRKIKNDPLRLKDAEMSEESRFWKFRHEKFQQGRQDLLCEIKKANTTENADKQDVDSLKNEIKYLKDRLASMTQDMDHLTSVVDTCMQQQPPSALPLAFYPPVKKSKVVSECPSPVHSTNNLSNTVSNPESILDPIPAGSFTKKSVVFEGLNEVGPPSSSIVKPVRRGSRLESIGALSFSTQEENMLSSLFALDGDELNVINDCTQAYSGCVDPAIVHKLEVALSSLPRSIQSAFVERLVAAIAEPALFKQQLEAMTTLSMQAADEACRRLESSGSSSNDSKAIPLASAVLGCYLSRYVSTAQVEEKQLQHPPQTTRMQQHQEQQQQQYHQQQRSQQIAQSPMSHQQQQHYHMHQHHIHTMSPPTQQQQMPSAPMTPTRSSVAVYYN